MSEDVWLPALVVLGAGLVFGVVLALRLRAGGRGSEPASEPDLRLRIRDCEARRDELYLRLRAAEEEELSEDERAALEKAAARSLLELDRLTARLPAPAVEKRRGRPAAAAAPAAAERPVPTRSRHPLLVGFAYGAGLMLVVALLVYWAVRDARPRSPGAAAPAPMAEAQQPPHEADLRLTPELAAKVRELEAQLVTDPEDSLARKELALALLAGGDFFAAFSQAQQVLERSPDDPAGLLVQGVVRLTMGQNEPALEMLDRVLAQDPRHSQALLYRGLALYQSGNREQAVDTWELALEMAGGRDADLEELLAMAAAGDELGAAALPADHPPVAAGAAAETTLEADSFRLRVELAPGAVAQPQATLFVFLRDGEGGPPVAVRRVPAPTFPLELSLGAGDSMMGDELPASGILVARLDSDGAASTTSEADLEAQAAGSQGELTRLVLRP